MTKNSNNGHAYGGIADGVWTAALNIIAPSDNTTAYPAGWYETGWISDTGITEAASQQQTKKYGWQGGALFRILRSQSEHKFSFQALEENAVTMGLLRPNSVNTATAGAAEVQTITMTGTGTAGTFTITVPGYASTTPLAYNAATTAVASALSTAVGGTVTVTGTPGSSYVVTFPVALGNVGLMTVLNSITGVTAINVAETTPGVSGLNKISVAPFTGRNLRQFGIDMSDGVSRKRLYIPNGEATATGNVAYKSNDLTVWNFDVECYPDTSGNFFYDFNTNAALAPGQFV